MHARFKELKADVREERRGRRKMIQKKDKGKEKVGTKPVLRKSTGTQTHTDTYIHLIDYRNRKGRCFHTGIS